MVEKDAVVAGVCGAIKEHISSIDTNTIQAGDDLTLLGMDSLTFIRIVISLEEVFEIEIPEEYLLVSAMDTIEKMANAVCKELLNDREE